MSNIGNSSIKEIEEFKTMLNNKSNDDLLSIESRLSCCVLELSNFIQWYRSLIDNNIKFTKKEFYEKSCHYHILGRNWMGYMCRTCKKSEIPDSMHRLHVELCKYNIKLYWVNEALKLRARQKSNDKLRKEVVAKLLNKLYTSIENNPNLFSKDEIVCIEGLIESGSIRTSAELKRYGVY